MDVKLVKFKVTFCFTDNEGRLRSKMQTVDAKDMNAAVSFLERRYGKIKVTAIEKV